MQRRVRTEQTQHQGFIRNLEIYKWTWYFNIHIFIQNKREKVSKTDATFTTLKHNNNLF